MSATKAAAAYAELDKLATDSLISKARKAARRVNWRHYAVWAKGFRKKFFGSLAKARAYWNHIKSFGSIPSIQSYRFKSAMTTCTTVVCERKAANDNVAVSKPYPIAIVRPNPTPPWFKRFVPYLPGTAALATAASMFVIGMFFTK